jgi:hypothetical protein
VVGRVGIAICSQVTKVGSLSGLGFGELPQILPPDDTRPITLDYNRPFQAAVLPRAPGACNGAQSHASV